MMDAALFDVEKKKRGRGKNYTIYIIRSSLFERAHFASMMMSRTTTKLVTTTVHMLFSQFSIETMTFCAGRAWELGRARAQAQPPDGPQKLLGCQLLNRKLGKEQTDNWRLRAHHSRANNARPKARAFVNSEG